MIAFFGASITKQIGGYPVHLKKMFKENVEIFGYGGMHLNNGGILFADIVIEKRPNYCFIDWLGTTNRMAPAYVEVLIDTLIYKFSQANCKLIFLFLPHKPVENWKENNDHLKIFLRKREVFYIDLYEHINSLDGILKDDLHTTLKGSKLYAKIIFNIFNENKKNITIPKLITKTKYTDVKKIHVGKSFEDKVILQSSGKVEILGSYITVGPTSGIIFAVNKNSTKKFNTWDHWCHYFRKHFHIPYINESLIIDGETKLIVTQELFDTRSSRRNIDYSKFKKKLFLHDIYYIGNELFVKNIKEGKPIPYAYIFWYNILSRASKYLNKLKSKLKKG